MKVAILGEYPSQPAKNVADSIKKYSKHEVTLHHRFNNLSKVEADVIYYYNILDFLMYRGVREQIVRNNYKICTSIRSWKLNQTPELVKTLQDLEDYITVLSANNEELLKTTQFKGKKVRTYIAPDDSIFKKTNSISKKGNLRVGYVGTFREDKRFKSILEPIFKKYEQILDTKIYGNAGKTITHKQMVEAYNEMDVLTVASRWEGSPLPPMEAALCERMTITTECGEMRDIFDYKSAVLIPNVEQIASLVAAFEDAIIDLYTHRKDAVVKGEEARKVVLEKRNWKDIIKFYDDMFEETLNG